MHQTSFFFKARFLFATPTSIGLIASAQGIQHSWSYARCMTSSSGLKDALDYRSATFDANRVPTPSTSTWAPIRLPESTLKLTADSSTIRHHPDHETMEKKPAVSHANIENQSDVHSTTIPDEVDLHNAERWRCTLYQFESCPFCRKVRCCLDYLGIPYTVVEVHPLSKKQLKKITQYRKVPVLEIREQTGADAQENDAKELRSFILIDSKKIVEALLHHEGRELQSSSSEAKEAERAWVQWADEVLVQLIVMNIYRNLKESQEAFSYLLTHPSFNWIQRRSAELLGTVVMYWVSRKRKEKYRVVNERESLYAAIDEFIQAKGERPFHGGCAPSEADINVYGILRSIEGFTTERDILQNTKVGAWMSYMKAATVKSMADRTIPRGPQATEQKTQDAQ